MAVQSSLCPVLSRFVGLIAWRLQLRVSGPGLLLALSRDAPPRITELR